MTLRVYFNNEDGTKDFIDYGCNTEGRESVYKVELREDSSKVKSYTGSKWTGIKEIDEQIKRQDEAEELAKATKLLEEKKAKEQKILSELLVKEDYQIFDYKKHDTDKIFYWFSGLCNNCNTSCQITRRMGEKIEPSKVRKLTCPRCKVKNTLRYAKWDGTKYVAVDWTK